MLIYKFFENCPKTHREFPKNNVRKLYQKDFPEFHDFPKFSGNFETILINVHFQFCLGVDPSGRMPDDQPIKLRESRAG